MCILSEKFVCETRTFSTLSHPVAAPLFRCSVDLSALPDTAELTVTGLGFYELFVNGKRLTRGVLAPYVSNPDQVVCYDIYNIKSCLQIGKNVLGFALGNGMNDPMAHTWNFNEAVYTSSPKLAFALEMCDQNGKRIVEADQTVCTPSAILFDNHRIGVHYDARLAHDNWAMPTYDDSLWHAPLTAETPRGVRRISGASPIIITEERKPVSFGKGVFSYFDSRREDAQGMVDGVLPEPPPKTEGYLYDFGVNDSGVFRLTLKNATKGQRIDIICGEILDASGALTTRNIGDYYPQSNGQRYIYYCRGDETETFVPPFCYIGYRYAFVEGVREDQVQPDLITYLVAHSDMPVRGGFSCSDEMANRLWEISCRSDWSNFWFFPTDCPHREKNGWTGDAATSAEHMMYEFGAEKNYKEWLVHIRAAQNAEGALPGIVPTAGWGYAWGNGPAWDRVLFELPFMMYRFRGDTDSICDNAHAMLRYLEYISRKRNADGLVDFGLGDWVPTGDKDADAYDVPLTFTNGVMIMDICRKAESMFRAVGLSLHAAFAKTLGSEMREAVRRAFLPNGSQMLKDRSQSEQALGLYYGVFDESEKEQAFACLLELLKETNDYFTCGYMGLRVLFHVLAEYGECEKAYRLITRKEFPSYGFFAEHGFTTLPEQIRYPLDIGESYNHHFLGDINHWFLRQIVGLCQNPTETNPNSMTVAPHFIGGLTYADGYHEVPAGKVRVHWEKDKDASYLLTVEAPKACEVTILLPQGYTFADGSVLKRGNFKGTIQKHI